jgi:hypothetical protein
MSEILLTPQHQPRPTRMVRDVKPEIAEEDIVKPNDVILAKQIADVLVEHYPGHPWMVHVDSAQGVAYVREQILSMRHGYVIRLPDIYSASQLVQAAMRAGGEILERFGMTRGRFDGEQWAGLATNAAGLPVFHKD